MAADPERLRFGIEAELALVDVGGTVRDFSTLTYAKRPIVTEPGPGLLTPEVVAGTR